MQIKFITVEKKLKSNASSGLNSFESCENENVVPQTERSLPNIEKFS